MRKILLRATFPVLALFLLSGCVATPIVGMVYTDIQGPVAATSQARSPKVGTATAVGYLGLVAMGDASIETAMKNGHITKIHHVDHKSYSILGIYNKFTTIVHGE
ncbi:hypothetical protein G3N55_04065 [Dissulfurirhabdus thermomarina]|uniref:TRL-like protein family n=1 Tax=Dissulfurirhabdus thermomarina TaxID=1765737 RepID=A0A6N9TLB9_DISTH|nr:TRL-like family protein [Dissulfurirhabdus thermomarina]NDY42025.1 hypothetical protein [Dissulfurirhabdus thermomarina]NMX23050.1 hypothetical protein [Dissulfurirhabdus thermomarina]